MRSDAKIGLICAFALVLAVIIYFVIQGNNHGQKAQAQPAAANSGGATAAPSPTVAGSAAAPAGAPVSVTPGAVLAQAGMGGPFISAPTSAPASTLPTAGGAPMTPATIPSLDGGTRLTDPATRPMTPPIIPTLPTPSTPSGRTGSGLGGSDTIQLPGGMDSGGRTGLGSGLGGSGLGGSGLGGGLGLPPTGGATTHKIAQGDMLGTIAKKYGVTVKAIEEANKGIDATRLKVGTTINIPAPTASHTTTSTTRPAATRPGRTTTAATHPAGGTTSGTASATPKPGSSYVVKKGDTLSTIARAAYGEKGSWKKIADANKTAVPNPNSVAIGTEIQIPQ